MAPIVMDLLNTWESVEHHYRAYGGWSWVLQDYSQEGFTSFYRTPEAKLLAEIEDPLSYFDRYVGMPKVGEPFYYYYNYNYDCDYY